MHAARQLRAAASCAAVADAVPDSTSVTSSSPTPSTNSSTSSSLSSLLSVRAVNGVAGRPQSVDYACAEEYCIFNIFDESHSRVFSRIAVSCDEVVVIKSRDSVGWLAGSGNATYGYSHDWLGKPSALPVFSPLHLNSSSPSSSSLPPSGTVVQDCFAAEQFANSTFFWNDTTSTPAGGSNNSPNTGGAIAVGFGVCGSSSWMGFGDSALAGLVNPDPVFYLAWFIALAASFVGAYVCLRMARTLRWRQKHERENGDNNDGGGGDGNNDAGIKPSSSLSCGVIVALWMLFYPCTAVISIVVVYGGCFPITMLVFSLSLVNLYIGMLFCFLVLINAAGGGVSYFVSYFMAFLYLVELAMSEGIILAALDSPAMLNGVISRFASEIDVSLAILIFAIVPCEFEFEFEKRRERRCYYRSEVQHVPRSQFPVLNPNRPSPARPLTYLLLCRRPPRLPCSTSGYPSDRVLYISLPSRRCAQHKRQQQHRQRRHWRGRWRQDACSKCSSRCRRE